VRYLAMGAMGLGMIFFGLEMMKNGFKPMRSVPLFQEAFSMFVADNYFGVLKCAAVGCLLTFLVQSSSATLGITIGLAATGAIPFESAAALVLGENIGTTITAWLASIGATTTAKRAAYAHVAFNLIGVFWITAIFLFYVDLVDGFVAWKLGAGPIGLETNHANYAQIVTFGIAVVHTGFNITNTLLFLPFVRTITRLLERFVPDRGGKEIPHLSTLDVRLVESPILAIENSRGEISKMASGVQKMLEWTREILISEEPDEALVKKVFHRETVMDNVQEEVIHFLTNILSAETPHSVAIEARQQLRIADEYESISDYISGILKARLRLGERGLKLGDVERDRLLALHARIAAYVDLITEGFLSPQSQNLSRAVSESEAIKHAAKEMRNAHLDSLSRDRIDPNLSMSFSNMLNGYMKIRAHAKNIAESLDRD
jgi:phosphate:Na+ symporter